MYLSDQKNKCIIYSKSMATIYMHRKSNANNRKRTVDYIYIYILKKEYLNMIDVF